MKTTDFIECEVRQHATHGIQAMYWCRLKSRNGKIVFASETYYSKANCKRAATKFGKKYGIPVRVAWERKAVA